MKPKKILIIGSTCYKKDMKFVAKSFERLGHEVRLPTLDKDVKRSIDVIRKNSEDIKWCDCAVMLWDCRSVGTQTDFTSLVLEEKPLHIWHINEITMLNAMLEYAEEHRKWFEREIWNGKKKQ